MTGDAAGSNRSAMKLLEELGSNGGSGIISRVDAALPPSQRGIAPIELVSNCHPHHVCQDHVVREYGSRVVMHSPRQRSAAVAATLSMTESNAEMFYDLYRCARCPLPLVPGRPSDTASSFFHAVDMLHARMHGVPNSDGVRII
eukprot:CAMPEP_0181170980 /NCGR_PEP_ID=MMETSP1096-20121128/1658_1 /TAXON_ID=156174 ORGANISM="Chrysochromulina ericina, Strain CCMP281" /NCGR_SAMPLE_ID=MMETSP1096 /ASSEMBLY_ACC=CAM_ASM_000453 /LENGTH=143 /DNA_ID=CAMNT_0023258583 /DNA_START=558 /DNA_END=989 /DNA_ORIENTATION=+